MLKAKIGSVMSLGAVSLIWSRQESLMGILGGSEATFWGQIPKKASFMHRFTPEKLLPARQSEMVVSIIL